MSNLVIGDGGSSPMNVDDATMASSGFVTSDMPHQRLRNNDAALFVGGLSFSATEEDLRHAFGGIGPIVSVRIVQDRETGKPRGFAFVNFETPECVDTAIRECQGMDLCGRNVRLDRSAAGIIGRGNGMAAGRIGRPNYNGGYFLPNGNTVVPSQPPSNFYPAGVVPPEYFMFPQPMGHPMMAGGPPSFYGGAPPPFPGPFMYPGDTPGGMMPQPPGPFGMGYHPVGMHSAAAPPPPAAPPVEEANSVSGH